MMYGTSDRRQTVDARDVVNVFPEAAALGGDGFSRGVTSSFTHLR